jgi:hypothetical protein
MTRHAYAIEQVTITAAPTEARIPRRHAVTGAVLSGIAVAFLLFDSLGKLLKVAPVVEGTAQLGYPEGSIRTLGVILLTCVVVYLIPRWAIVGGVLLTGYLGGAVATHLRVGSPLLTHVLFPLYVGVFVWGGLLLRDARVRQALRPPDQAG